MLDEPHHDGSALYVSTAAPSLCEDVTVWVRVPRAATAVHVRTTPDGEPHIAPLSVDPDRARAPIGGYGAGDVWWRGRVAVRNPVTRYRFLIHTASDAPRWLTASGLHDHDVPDGCDFRLIAHEAPPSWTDTAIVYEVFPDRFARSRSLEPTALPDWAVAADWDSDPVIGEGPPASVQFFGGDLDGIIEHLDHIQDLGADTIYLRPVFPGRSNHRYDASTFDRVDPLLGGDAALHRLAEAVHARGMRLVGDLTTNHCGDGHEWFVAARGHADAPERQMFYFDDEGGYEAWYGVPSLPKLNWGSPLVRERMGAIVRRWLALYDGWRIDVANMTGRRGADDGTHDVARALRHEAVSARPDAMLLAEHNHDATDDLDRDGWQGTMFYAGFTRPLWTWLRGDALDLPDFIGVPGGVPRRAGPDVLATIRAFAAQMSWRSLTHSWQLLDSFDCARFRTVAGSRERHLVGVGLQMTLPGTPMICSGSEFGLTGRNGEYARTPMPWNRPDDRDEATLLAYRELIGLRRTEPALSHGGLRWVYADADTLLFLRETADQSLLVAARRASGAPVALSLDVPAHGVYDAPDLAPAGGTITVPADGPSLRIWRLG